MLVLADRAPLVLAHAAQADQPGLDVASHMLLVDVEAGGRVPRQDAVGDEAAQSLGLDVKVGYSNPVDQPVEPATLLATA